MFIGESYINTLEIAQYKFNEETKQLRIIYKGNPVPSILQLPSAFDKTYEQFHQMFSDDLNIEKRARELGNAKYILENKV